MESEFSYESQTRAAFFKGELGGLLDTSSAEVDLDSMVIRAEDLGEDEEEQGGTVVSRGQAMVRNASRSIVLENIHVIADDTRETVPPNSQVIVESAGLSNPPGGGRESIAQDIQVVMEVPSGVIVENPSIVEEERDAISPTSQVTEDGLQGVIVENLQAEREGDDAATQLPPSEAIVGEEQGCTIFDNPDASVEERDGTDSRRRRSDSGVEGSPPVEDQVMVHDGGS